MLSNIIYDIETSIREIESSFLLSDLKKKEKDNNFYLMCRFVCLANDSLTYSKGLPSTQAPLIALFYGSNLSLNGCFQPNLTNIFEGYFSEECNDDISDAYLNTELHLWKYDDICEFLDNNPHLCPVDYE